jgi:predicted Rossmann fold nucleotide-binding protein DprA/Smf involved in DNA uptake
VDLLVATAGAAAQAGAATAEVLTALTELELLGLIRQEPGMVFGLV